MLVRIVKDWDWPDLLRQTPSASGEWSGVRFTTQDVEACDYLVMLNHRMQHKVRVFCPPNRVWMVVQEPYHPGVTDWIMEGHEPFARVFTHHPPDGGDRYRLAQPAIPWHVNRSYDELEAMAIPEKSRLLSWVVGNARDLPGHLQRLALFEHVRATLGDRIDLFGRAIRPIADKWDALAPYYFSLAVENNRGPDMWTEKLADCYLAWSVPLYYGCTNLTKYFPAESFIPIDINAPGELAEIIRREATPERWRQRVAAIARARQLVLTRYQLFPFLTEQILADTDPPLPSRQIIIHPYRRSPRSWWYRQQYKLNRLLTGRRQG